MQGAFFITLDKLDKIGWDGVRAELASLGLSVAPVAGVEEKILGLEGLPANKLAGALAEAVPGLDLFVIDDLVVVASCLDRLPGVSWEFDPTLVRGMGYYTGPIFEVQYRDSRSSIAGGGRYDRMIGTLLGRDVPATGFSIGFERVIGILMEGEPLRAESRERVALIFEDDTGSLTRVLQEARRLRDDGRVVSLEVKSKKLGKQLQELGAQGVRSIGVFAADGSLEWRDPQRRG